MRILLALLLLGLAGGCVRLPDRMILSYQRDPDTGDEKCGMALSFPITYGREYRPIFEPDAKR